MINILTITDIVINNFIIVNIPIIISITTNLTYALPPRKFMSSCGEFP